MYIRWLIDIGYLLQKIDLLLPSFCCFALIFLLVFVSKFLRFSLLFITYLFPWKDKVLRYAQLSVSTEI